MSTSLAARSVAPRLALQTRRVARRAFAAPRAMSSSGAETLGKDTPEEVRGRAMAGADCSAGRRRLRCRQWQCSRWRSLSCVRCSRLAMCGRAGGSNQSAPPAPARLRRLFVPYLRSLQAWPAPSLAPSATCSVMLPYRPPSLTLVPCPSFTPSSPVSVRFLQTWKSVLSAEEYHVLRQKGTERPGTGEYNKVRGGWLSIKGNSGGKGCSQGAEEACAEVQEVEAAGHWRSCGRLTLHCLAPPPLPCCQLYPEDGVFAW